MPMTPGPWKCRAYAGGRWVYPTTPADAAPIALVDGDNPEADWHLIAACPDLLEACKAAVTLDLITDPDERRRVVLMLLAALAKTEAK